MARLVDGASIVSPMWRINVPARIVRYSSLLCQCGGILNPAGILRRNVNGAFFEGSPCNTAMSAPLGRSGGAGPHLISAALMDIASGFALAASAANAGVAASRANANIVDRVFIEWLLGGLAAKANHADRKWHSAVGPGFQDPSTPRHLDTSTLEEPPFSQRRRPGILGTTAFRQNAN